MSILWSLFLHGCVFTVMFGVVICWDQRELDMYDLIEEVGMKPNFYELLGVTENATSSEVRRSFRQLSLIHHPDKTDVEDSHTKFRRMVAMYEILRDREKREIYDKFLVDGMPDWRSAVYYYRRARKMGMLEITVILSLIITVGQYLTSWAGYKEKLLAVEDAARSRFKRGRKVGKDVDFDDMVEKCMEQFPKPSWWNTLPCQTVRGARWLVCSAPCELVEAVRSERQRRQHERAEVERAAADAEEERAEAQRQRDRRKEQKERRRKRVQELPEAGPESADAAVRPELLPTEPAHTWSTARSGPWMDEDLVELARLVKRHPGGTIDRWEVIAEALERTVPEVTRMARQIRDRPHMVPVAAAAQSATGDAARVPDSVLEPSVPPPPRKVKTRAAELDAEEAAWSQTQQKAFEAALAQFPKGASERWERICKVVPGKTKEECMLRFRYLAEMVKRRKEAEREEAESQSAPAAADATQATVVSAPAVRCSDVPEHAD